MIDRTTLEYLKALPENWDSYNGRRVTDAALIALRCLTVVPRSNGGVQVEMHIRGGSVEIDIAPDGKLEAVMWDANRPAEGEGTT
jgi:hypothetical protein